MKKIVHFDLKGAPLQLPYLKKVLIQAKAWGATGILLEWEDTFPYHGELEAIGSIGGSGGDGMYTLEEVKHLLQFAKDNGLETIQLIQTIGHMEFVLKHPTFRHLREAAQSSAVLCPSKPESQLLVRAMLDQVLDAQPDAKYLHIGADEVWHTGVCSECAQRAETSEYHRHSLFLDHIRDLVLYLKQKRPELIVLMWDDMLRTIRLDTLKAYNLGELVQPVMWHYYLLKDFWVDANMWDRYGQVFPHVWAGSAYKGANGSCQILCPVSRYVSNHDAWLREFNTYGSSVNFTGIILTGWSRYDHYATLCELLPVALPSLASCLKIMANPDVEQRDMLVSDSLPSEQWPGEELARCIHSLVILRDRITAFENSETVKTWLSPWQIEHNYTNPVQVEGIAQTAHTLEQELTTLQVSISGHLRAVTGARSAQEWEQATLAPYKARLVVLCRAVQRALANDASVAPATCSIDIDDD